MHLSRRTFFAAACLASLLMQGCAGLQAPPEAEAPPEPPSAKKKAPVAPANLPQTGEASWYGAQHHGKRQAAGAIFDQTKLTAAHRTLPFGTRVKVTNLSNGKTVSLRINDRGPHRKGRGIDVSYVA